MTRQPREIVWSPRSLEDLARYRPNPDEMRGLQERAKEIAEKPLHPDTFPRLGDPLSRYFFAGRFLVRYRHHTNEITIVSVHIDHA